MKQTRTTLKALTAAYRAVLRHGILCNAIALGLIAGPVYAGTVTTASELNTALQSGSEITVANNISGIDSVTTASGKTNSLDLGGKTLSGATEATSGYVFSGGSLTLAGGGTISGLNHIDDISPNSLNGDEFGALNASGTNVTMTGGDWVFSGNTAAAGAINVSDAIFNANVDTIAFENNVSNVQGAGFRHDAYSTNGTYARITADEITFRNNSFLDDPTVVVGSGAGAMNSRGTMELLGDVNTFENNDMNAHVASGRVYKVGGGAVANQSGYNESTSTAKDATMVIGKDSNSVNTFTGNHSSTSGGAIMNRAVNEDGDAALTINGSSTFTNNQADMKGGAIYNISEQIAIDTGGGNLVSQKRNELNLTGVSNTFTNNEAGQKGGAVYNSGYATINNATFTGNHTTGVSYEEFGASQQAQGGAIYNTGADELYEKPSMVYWAAEGILSISNSTFGQDGVSASGNSALQGGAIANNRGQGSFYDGNIVLTNTNFYNNKAYADTDDSDGYSSSLGGAIWNAGKITVNGDTTFKGNAAEGYNVEGGAIYNSGSLTFNDAVTFDSNTATDKNSGNGAYGGAIANSADLTFKDFATFKKNKALSTAGKGTQGGAINNENVVTIEKGALFEDNGAVYGGAVFNGGTLNLTDVSFKNNTAGDEGGAIFNLFGTTNINAVTENVIFSGNTADEEVNDITNYYGTLNFNAANGKSISLEGISGPSGTLNINSVGGNTGTVEISEYLANHTVNVDAGELHLTTGEANLYKSNVFVADGATINTIDDEINDYMTGAGNNGVISLDDGALIKGDIDYAAGLADTYNAADGAGITYKMANALGADVQYGGEKEIRITNAGATINKAIDFSWYDSAHGLTLTSGGAGTGTVLVSGTAGGINTAVDDTNETAQEIGYTVTAAAETFNGADNVIQNADFAITGNGNETTDNTITFATDMIVDGTSTLSLTDVVLAKTDEEAIENRAGAVLNVTESRIGVNIRNFGTMVSDPTFYDAKVINEGTASFTGDVFANGSSLTNSAIVNLNNVTFESGSTLTGLAGNVLNVAGTTNQFGGASTGNNVVFAHGANFTGTLADGSIDARNGGIDTFTGSISGGDLYVDADLVAGTTDTFGGVSSAIIRGVKLANTGYGTENTKTLALSGAEFANDVDIDGFSYYTHMENNGTDLVFSDKLINESNLDTKLGSWTGGAYIKSNTDMNTAADANHLTVGSALSALDTAIGDMSGFGTNNDYATNTTSMAANIGLLDDQVKANADTIATKANANNAVLTGITTAESLTVGGNAVLTTASSLDGSKLTDNTVDYDALTAGLQGSIDKANSALQSGANISELTNNAGYQTAGQVDSTVDTKIAALDLSNTYANKSTVESNFTAVYGAINDAKADAISTAASDATTKANDALDAAKAYVDGKGYQTASDVNTAITNALGTTGAITTAINSALTDYSTTTEMNTAIDDKIAAAVTGTGAVATAINNVVGDRSNYTEHNIIANGEDIATSLDKLDMAVADKQDAIIDNDFIVSDGASGLKVKDAAIGTTQLNSAVNASLAKANSAVQSVSTGSANGTINVDGTDVTVAGWSTKQDVISDTTTIVKDGTGLKVANGSIGSTQLDSTVNASLDKANSAVQTVAEGSANGTISVDGTNVAVHGLGSAAYSDTSAFDAAGAAAAAETAAIAAAATDATTKANAAQAAAITAANDYTDTQLSLARTATLADANAYTDRRIEDLDKNLSAGVAGAVALSSVAVSGVGRGEVSVGAGYGYFNGQSAAAFGATMGLSNRWSINAGAGISNADVSFRAGTNYKFKLF